MKLTYWIAECLNDSACYSVIGRTKKETIQLLNQRWNPESFGPIQKREIEYKDAFDLFEMITGEGGGRNW